MRLSFTAPIRLVSEANTREHWAKKHKRAKGQRAAALMAMRAAGSAKLEPPYVVVLTRIAPRVLDDDNLARAFKAVRDSVAEALRVDDGDTRQIRWAYRQERGEPKEYAIRVTVY